MQEEWIKVTEDLPQHAKGYDNVTDYVTVMRKDGSTCEAFYADKQDNWYGENGKRVTGVVAWKTR